LLLAKREERVNIQGQKGQDRKPRGPLARKTVAQIRSVLSSLLSLAVEDEVLGSNPALGISHQRRTKAARIRSRARVGESVKAMDFEQRNRLLATAAGRDPECYPAFMLGALAGLRLGELLGLKWPSVDFSAHRLRVHEQLGSSTTKSGTERFVEMAGPLAEFLRELLARRREESFRSGSPLSPWVMFPWLSERPTAQEQQRAEKRVRRAMEVCLKAARLPTHFTPHSLRHTFCSLLIASGVSPVYVQQQAGHASVKMTVDVYGSWFAVEAPGAMDRLAAGVPGTRASGNKTAESGNKQAEAEATSLPPTGTCGRSTATRPSPG
jgi:integrase